MVTTMLICESKIHDAHTPNQGEVSLRADTSEMGHTPFAKLEMGILNEKAFNQFEPGKTYRVTLEQID